MHMIHPGAHPPLHSSMPQPQGRKHLQRAFAPGLFAHSSFAYRLAANRTRQAHVTIYGLTRKGGQR